MLTHVWIHKTNTFCHIINADIVNKNIIQKNYFTLKYHLLY